MDSLLNMQRHTVMVQEDILHVQDIVKIKDKKAKNIISIMAVERMKVAVGNILNRGNPIMSQFNPKL